MSEEEDANNPRNALIRIVQFKGSSLYAIRIKFLEHITVEVKWDDSTNEGRADVCALVRDLLDMTKKAFVEIEIDRAAGGLDAELDALFNKPADLEEEDGE